MYYFWALKIFNFGEQGMGVKKTLNLFWRLVEKFWSFWELHTLICNVFLRHIVLSILLALFTVLVFSILGRKIANLKSQYWQINFSSIKHCYRFLFHFNFCEQLFARLSGVVFLKVSILYPITVQISLRAVAKMGKSGRIVRVDNISNSTSLYQLDKFSTISAKSKTSKYTHHSAQIA